MRNEAGLIAPHSLLPDALTPSGGPQPGPRGPGPGDCLPASTLGRLHMLTCAVAATAAAAAATVANCPERLFHTVDCGLQMQEVCRSHDTPPCSVIHVQAHPQQRETRSGPCLDRLTARFMQELKDGWFCRGGQKEFRTAP